MTLKKCSEVTRASQFAHLSLQGVIAESDVERRAHPGLWGPLVGAMKGVGNVFVGTAHTIGFVAGRLIPPKNPKINLPHLLEGFTVLVTGPAFLGILFATFYLDAERRGEVGSFDHAFNY